MPHPQDFSQPQVPLTMPINSHNQLEQHLLQQFARAKDEATVELTTQLHTIFDHHFAPLFAQLVSLGCGRSSSDVFDHHDLSTKTLNGDENKSNQTTETPLDLSTTGATVPPQTLFTNSHATPPDTPVDLTTRSGSLTDVAQSSNKASLAIIPFFLSPQPRAANVSTVDNSITQTLPSLPTPPFLPPPRTISNSSSIQLDEANSVVKVKEELIDHHKFDLVHKIEPNQLGLQQKCDCEDAPKDSFCEEQPQQSQQPKIQELQSEQPQQQRQIVEIVHVHTENSRVKSPNSVSLQTENEPINERINLQQVPTNKEKIIESESLQKTKHEELSKHPKFNSANSTNAPALDQSSDNQVEPQSFPIKSQCQHPSTEPNATLPVSKECANITTTKNTTEQCKFQVILPHRESVPSLEEDQFESSALHVSDDHSITDTSTNKAKHSDRSVRSQSSDPLSSSVRHNRTVIPTTNSTLSKSTLESKRDDSHSVSSRRSKGSTKTESSRTVSTKRKDRSSSPVHRTNRRQIEPSPPKRACVNVTTVATDHTTAGVQLRGKFVQLSLTCEKCHQRIEGDETDALEKHQLQVHGQHPYRCLHVHCKGRNFRTAPELNKHLDDRHLTETEWDCANCSLRFPNRVQLTQHDYYEHQEGTFECDACPFIGLYRGSMVRHFDLEHGSRIITRTGLSSTAIPDDVQSHHSGSDRATITDELTLEPRANVSIIKKPSIYERLGGGGGSVAVNNIDVKPKLFDRLILNLEDDNEEDLVRYSVTSVVCCYVNLKRPCGKIFPCNNSMLRHMATAHKVFTFRCPVVRCTRTFSKRKCMDTHVLTSHRDIRKWFCPVRRCGYSTGADHWSMHSHLFLCHQEGIFRCAIADCEQIFKFRSQAIEHYDRYHLSVSHAVATHSNHSRTVGQQYITISN